MVCWVSKLTAPQPGQGRAFVGSLRLGEKAMHAAAHREGLGWGPRWFPYTSPPHWARGGQFSPWGCLLPSPPSPGLDPDACPPLRPSPTSAAASILSWEPAGLKEGPRRCNPLCLCQVPAGVSGGRGCWHNPSRCHWLIPGLEGPPPPLTFAGRTPLTQLAVTFRQGLFAITYF